MNTKNKKPISVDFNNADIDGAIRLTTSATLEAINEQNLNLVEGEKIWITDGEIEEIGTLALREGAWVSISEEGTLKM